MSLFKPTGSKYWYYRFYINRRPFNGETKTTSKRKAEAIQAARKEAEALNMARAARGEVVTVITGAPAKVPTLETAATTWWDAKGKDLGRPTDEVFRLKRLTNAVELVGKDKRVTQLRTIDIHEAIQKRRGRLVKAPGQKGKGHVPANATVNRDIIETIRPVIRHACALLEVSPPPIKWGELALKRPKPWARDFADDAVERFYATLPEHWRDFARFEARYGLRVGEMFFDPAEVKLVDGQWRVDLLDRKADDELGMPLLPEDGAMLAARKSRAEAAALDTVWFRQLKGGRIKALKYNSAIWAVRQALRKAGLSSGARGAKGTHDLRHHAAMRMLRATGDIKIVQELLGHADPRSTDVYARATKKDVRRGLEAVAKCQGIDKAEEVAGETASENKAVGG